MSLYNIFYSVKHLLRAELIEISLKQSQVSFIFKEGEVLYHNDLEELSMLRDAAFFDDQEDIWITVFEKNPIVVVPLLKKTNEPIDATFRRMHKYIKRLSEGVCTCPSLEIAFTDQYIKFFLDKPGLTIKDLTTARTILGEREETFEFHAQRPYMLFINTRDNDVQSE